MAGIYDWILNSLKVDQSPATNQLPMPIPSQNLTGLPVPFQEMPSESASGNSFNKLTGFMTNPGVNPMIPQDTGTNPTAPNDPLKTYMIQNFKSGMVPTGINSFMPASAGADGMTPPSADGGMRKQMIMQMLMGNLGGGQ